MNTQPFSQTGLNQTGQTLNQTSQTGMFVYKLSGCGFKSRFSHFNLFVLLFLSMHGSGRLVLYVMKVN